MLWVLYRQCGVGLRLSRACSSGVVMKYLNVAEKNDAAKSIAGHISRGTARRREGLSTFNKIYEFETTVLGQNAAMVMTSVSGHLLTYEFVGSYRSWQSCNPLYLFEAPVVKSCSEKYQNIKKTLEREIRSCQGLIIWTDCDREGENIGFEIIQVCSDIKSNLKIYRAKFSEITGASINRALQTLGTPDKNVNNAVDVRQELDLRIGAAFTRFQTLRLQKVFPDKLAQSLVSYGSCQFPTLGFVVERYRAVENFVPEKFWKLKVSHTMNNLTVDFTWKRGRLFDEQACVVLYDVCREDPTATVVDVKSKSKSKWRPLPLDTIELEKLGSRKLRINAKEVMRIAEKLYTQGIISYPRTETNIYPKELNLTALVEMQGQDYEWGQFAQRILNNGGPTPRQGSKCDQAHPPIHPTKHVTNLSGDDKKVYELIVRSFLACCSSDAQGHETIVEIEVGRERFSANGLVIIARNYLDVYPYDKWSAKEIHHYEAGQSFQPTGIEMLDGQTSPPNLLTEADLIALMEKHGIGTDATHADHIETIKCRSYVALADSVHFVPGHLGMGLVEGYDSMELAHSFSKPQLRAGLEADLKEICQGRKRPQDVLSQQIAKYREAYVKVNEEAIKIDQALSQRFNQTPLTFTSQDNDSAPNPLQNQRVMKCPKCGCDMVVRTKKDSSGLYISCLGYPQCKNVVWLPPLVDKVKVLDEHCSTCGSSYNKLEMTWKGRSLDHMFPSPHKCCIGGCDTNILQALNISPSTVTKNSTNSQPSRLPPGAPAVDGASSGNRTTTRILSQNSSNTINSGNRSTTQRTSDNNRNNTNHSSFSTSSDSRPVSNVGWFANASDSGYVTHNTRGNPSNSGDWGPQSSHGDDNEVVCNCGHPVTLLTVKKATVNCGRQFYKCLKSKESGGCDFFLWAISENDNSSSGGPPHPERGGGDVRGSYSSESVTLNNTWGNSAGDTPMCRCQQPAKKLTVQKEGANKGRMFYSCPNPPANKCNFFDWVDSAAATSSSSGMDTGWGAPSSSYNADSTRGRGRGRGRGAGEGGGARRRCTVCREEGHTRNKCPRAGQ